MSTDFIKLDAQLNEMTAADKFAGTVMVACGNETLFQGAYGLADRENNIPMKIDTTINLGSCNKSFTAIAICQLQQVGLLDFDDTVEKHIPAMADLSQGRIKIHHLLMHTAGLGNYLSDDDYKADRHRITTISGIMPYIMRPLIDTPGKAHNYSNSGYVVLGAVIESITGIDYYDYVFNNIYKPAGMQNSNCFLNTDTVPNRAKGYTSMNEDAPFISNAAFLPLRGGAAGGGYSTAQDMLRYMAALRNDTFIKNTFSVISPPVDADYGFATMRFLSGSIGHTGGARGISAYYGVHLKTDLRVAILANVDMGVIHAGVAINKHIGIAPASK